MFFFYFFVVLSFLTAVVAARRRRRQGTCDMYVRIPCLSGRARLIRQDGVIVNGVTSFRGDVVRLYLYACVACSRLRPLSILCALCTYKRWLADDGWRSWDLCRVAPCTHTWRLHPLAWRLWNAAAWFLVSTAGCCMIVARILEYRGYRMEGSGGRLEVGSRLPLVVLEVCGGVRQHAQNLPHKLRWHACVRECVFLYMAFPSMRDRVPPPFKITKDCVYYCVLYEVLFLY